MASRDLKRRKLSPKNDSGAQALSGPLLHPQYAENSMNDTHLDNNGGRVLAYEDPSLDVDSDSQNVESSTDGIFEEQGGERALERLAGDSQVTNIQLRPLEKNMTTTTNAKRPRAADTNAVFGSNMFKFQSDELLKQIRPNNISRKASLESTLRTLKTIIEQAPSIGPMPVNLMSTSAVFLY